ncbi:MAG: Gfo/Idh/MocA family oxidoreductase [Chloroflexota bacterium]|nr:Gfo/Idh/MocA family oxidoreductase [Chloroflexota bacterium]
MVKTDAEPIRVGIAGLGRSGWNIHVKTLQAFPEQYRVVAVADIDPARQREAQETVRCRAYGDVADLIRDDAVEVIVVATPNHLHTAHSVAALEAGRHVICEKPFALSLADADRALAAAARADRLIVPFQNRRYEPHFQKVLEIVQSGVLGTVLLVRLAWHSFGRRWDWQTLLDKGAGSLANNGPHMLDHAVHFLGAGEPEIFADLRNGLSSGDAEDHAKIVLKTPGGPTIDLELTSCAAFPQDRWMIMGTAGGLRGTTTALRWQWIDWSTMPARPVDPASTPDRSYNREALHWHEETWEGTSKGEDDNRAFYHDLYGTLRQDQPLKITPQSARRYVAILEHCRRVYATAP